MQIYPYGFIYRNFLIFVSFYLYELVGLTVTMHIVYFYLGQEWVVVLNYFMDNRKLNEVGCNQVEKTNFTFLLSNLKIEIWIFSSITIFLLIICLSLFSFLIQQRKLK